MIFLEAYTLFTFNNKLEISTFLINVVTSFLKFWPFLIVNYIFTLLVKQPFSYS